MAIATTIPLTMPPWWGEENNQLTLFPGLEPWEEWLVDSMIGDGVSWPFILDIMEAVMGLPREQVAWIIGMPGYFPKDQAGEAVKRGRVAGLSRLPGDGGPWLPKIDGESRSLEWMEQWVRSTTERDAGEDDPDFLWPVFSDLAGPFKAKDVFRAMARIRNEEHLARRRALTVEAVETLGGVIPPLLRERDRKLSCAEDPEPEEEVAFLLWVLYLRSIKEWDPVSDRYLDQLVEHKLASYSETGLAFPWDEVDQVEKELFDHLSAMGLDLRSYLTEKIWKPRR